MYSVMHEFSTMFSTLRNLSVLILYTNVAWVFMRPKLLWRESLVYANVLRKYTCRRVCVYVCACELVCVFVK